MTSSKKSEEYLWQQKQIKNGLRFLHAPLKNHDSRLHFSVLIKAGAANESKPIWGISHFLEHMMFRGSKNYPSFADLAHAFEWLGGEWNGATAHEYTEFTYDGVHDALDDVVRLFAEFICSPLLLDIERERQVILREIEDELNDFGHSTDFAVHMNNLLWPKSNLAHPITGHAENIKNITIEDLQQYRLEHYRPDNMIIIVACKGRSPSIFKLLEQHFKKFENTLTKKKIEKLQKPAVKKFPSFEGPKCLWIEHSDSQHHLQLSCALSEGEWSEKTLYYQLVSSILADGFSSRLCNRLREELGLVYDVHSHVSMFLNSGSLDINVSCSLEVIDRLFKEICLVLKKLKTDGPTLREVEKAKKRMLVDLKLLGSDLESMSFRLGWYSLWDQDPSYIKEAKEIEGVTQTLLHKTIRDVFNPVNIAIVVMGPQKAAGSQKKNLTDRLLHLLNSANL